MRETFSLYVHVMFFHVAFRILLDSRLQHNRRDGLEVSVRGFRREVLGFKSKFRSYDDDSKLWFHGSMIS